MPCFHRQHPIRIELNLIDARSVICRTAPAFRMRWLRGLINHVPRLQKSLILSLVRCPGITKRMPLCRCSLLYESMKRATHWHARTIVANLLLDHFGRYFKVRNSDSENGLSLLTRGQLFEAMMPKASSFALRVAVPACQTLLSHQCMP